MKSILFSNEKNSPKVDDINFPRLMRENLKRISEPYVDLNPGIPKTKFNSILTVRGIYSPKISDFTKSFILHTLLISTYFISLFLSKSMQLSPDVVEVDFGLTDTVTQTQAPTPPNASEGETEATKAKDLLPQLTKNVAPETTNFPFVPPRPQKELPLSKPSDKAKKVDLEIERKKAEKAQKEKLAELKHEKILQEEEEKKQKLKVKDYLQRKEMELRKEGIKNLAGTHNKDETKPLGHKINLNKIPTSPFASQNNIPDSPLSEVPTGNINGKISKSVFNNYQAYLARQLKLNWNASEGINFPPHIKTKVQFKVNEYGYLIGDIKTIETSGNANFDQNAITAVKRTFPVSIPPPKELHPPQIFQAIYSSSGGVQ